MLLKYKIDIKTYIGAISAFIITSGILILARGKASFDILIADRFLPGAGWIEILIVGLYAAFLSQYMQRKADCSKTRLTIWLVFSIVFFSQFILGILGLKQFLMTGTLHLPIPAVVIAGPVYRGERFFMPILFLSTVVLAGPAWCSYLCYFGAWDGLAASHRKHPSSIAPYWGVIRIMIFITTPVVAFVFRVAGVEVKTAVIFALGFGIIGIVVILAVSLRNGKMVHCISYCPLGFVSNWLGKISPFRFSITDSCNECGRCFGVCRYNALDKNSVQKRRPGITCTLCGDCLPVCREGALRYSLFNFSSKTARSVFLVLIVSIHAVFLSVARI